jgi:RNA polymerase sigma factor (sigma-70 family)
VATSTSNRTPRTVASQPQFVPTRWTVVLAAQQKGSPTSQEALESLCRAYWFPLYVFVRRQGHGPADAEDLTQEFFARLLAKDYLKAVDREKGRFRTFLLIALKRFLANEWDRTRAQKRGGENLHVSLDTTAAETRYEMEPSLEQAPERTYDRRWAIALLDRTMNGLREEFAKAGKKTEFEHLKIFLTAEKGSVDIAAIAKAVGTTEGNLRVAVHRLRRRYRELFREEIAHTVSTPEEIDGEVRHLISILAEG